MKGIRPFIFLATALFAAPIPLHAESGLVFGQSSGTLTGQLNIVSTGTAPAVSAQIWRNSDGTVVSSMSATGLLTASSITVSGKVGIGTTTPGETLTVNGGFVYSMTQNSVTGSRSFDTAYQNTSGRIMYVNVSGSRTNTGTITAFTDAASDPTTQVTAASGTTGYITPVFFIVLPGNYYKVTDTGGTTLSSWVEWY